MSVAWHGAWLQRVDHNKFPPLSKLLPPIAGAARAQSNGIDEADIKERFAALRRKQRESVH